MKPFNENRAVFLLPISFTFKWKWLRGSRHLHNFNNSRGAKLKLAEKNLKFGNWPPPLLLETREYGVGLWKVVFEILIIEAIVNISQWYGTINIFTNFNNEQVECCQEFPISFSMGRNISFGELRKQTNGKKLAVQS